MLSNIKIRSFTGSGIKTYIPSIAKLRAEIFKEYPFLHISGVDLEMQYLKKFTQCKEAIAAVIFDASKIVGATVGLPFEDKDLEMQQLFIDHGLNPADYFYFGESVLLQAYRGRGLGHHFFDIREGHVKRLKRFKSICFRTVVREKNHPQKPKNYIPLETFWEKRGYTQRPELNYSFSWKDLGESEESPKLIVFWTKEL